MAGVLEGVTVIELAGIGPAPFAGMMLADHGARVIRIDRPSPTLLSTMAGRDVVNRNREVLTLDLKTPDGVSALLDLASGADALIEGNRPGVIERLGLGPDMLLARNPALVVGRMTGWGQDGPRKDRAGHDINYVALSGALSTWGRRGGKPTFPSNLVADYGGGGMMLAFGVVSAILSARATGKGQVIDCAMVDGAAILSAMTYGLFAQGMWRQELEANVLDGGAPYYETYATSDGKWISIGPIEPEFHADLLDRLGLAGDPDFASQMDRAAWPRAKVKLEALFATRTRDEWCALFDDIDVCFAPVLTLTEAPRHPHNRARGTFVEVDGIVQPAPAPRFLGTPAPPVRLEPR